MASQRERSASIDSAESEPQTPDAEQGGRTVSFDESEAYVETEVDECDDCDTNESEDRNKVEITEDNEVLRSFILNEELTRGHLNRRAKRNHATKSRLKEAGVRGIFYRLAESKRFNWIFGMLVVCNVVIIVLDINTRTDMLKNAGDAAVLQSDRRILRLSALFEYILVAFFIFEITIRMIGSPVQPWREGWLLLDAFLVLLSAIDAYIVGPLLGATSGFGQAARAARVFRVFRGLRVLFRQGKLTSVQIIMSAIGSTLFHATWIFVLLAFTTLAMAMILTSIVGNRQNPVDDNMALQVIQEELSLPLDDMFSSVQDSVISLAMINLNLIHWGPTILWPMLFANDPRWQVAGSLLLIYIGFQMFCLKYVTLGVLLSGLMENAQEEEEALQLGEKNNINEASRIKNLQDLFKTMVEGLELPLSEAFVTVDVFVKHMSQEEALKKLLIGKCSHREEESRLITAFNQIDIYNDGRLCLDEFVVGILKYVRVGKNIDFAHMDWQQRRMLREVTRISSGFTGNWKTLTKYIDDLSTQVLTLSKKCSETVEIAKSVEQAEWRRSAAPSDFMFSERMTLQEKAVSVMKETLDKRFDYSNRIAKIEGKIESLQELPSTVDDQLLEVLQDVMNEVLFSAAMPWLKKKMREANAKRAALLNATRIASGPMPPSELYRLMESIQMHRQVSESEADPEELQVADDFLVEVAPAYAPKKEVEKDGAELDTLFSASLTPIVRDPKEFSRT